MNCKAPADNRLGLLPKGTAILCQFLASGHVFGTNYGGIVVHNGLMVNVILKCLGWLLLGLIIAGLWFPTRSCPPRDPFLSLGRTYAYSMAAVAPNESIQISCAVMPEVLMKRLQRYRDRPSYQYGEIWLRRRLDPSNPSNPKGEIIIIANRPLRVGQWPWFHWSPVYAGFTREGKFHRLTAAEVAAFITGEVVELSAFLANPPDASR